MESKEDFIREVRELLNANEKVVHVEHLSHLKNSDMTLKDFLKAYKEELKELTDDEVIYTP